MKREDITKTFPEATDEQVSALLDINSGDIGKAKKGAEKLQADLDTANATLKAAQDTIEGLEASKGDTSKLQQQLDAYKTAEAERKAAETTAQLRAAVEARFNAQVGERAFVHEFVRKGALDEFEKALGDKTNAGKGDKDLFDALTTDKGFFATQNPPANMGGANTNIDKETDKDKYFKMPLVKQMEFANAHPEQVAEFMK
jgi:hypothetical protein